jgi:hypothetical protein
MTYTKLTINDPLYGEIIRIIRHNDDGSFTSFIPDDGITEYQAYLAWLAEGNEPLPADEEPK